MSTAPFNRLGSALHQPVGLSLFTSEMILSFASAKFLSESNQSYWLPAFAIRRGSTCNLQLRRRGFGQLGQDYRLGYRNHRPIHLGVNCWRSGTMLESF